MRGPSPLFGRNYKLDMAAEILAKIFSAELHFDANVFVALGPF